MQVLTPDELSREYYQFVNSFTHTDFEDEKLLGKFYTDYEIANSMMQVMCSNYTADIFSSNMKVIDPFCGDGRLIIALLSELLKKGIISGKKVLISVWDIDHEAVGTAEEKINMFCEEHNIQHEIDARVADAFVEYRNCYASYNICVTNPPWSLLKPQKLFNKTNDEEELEGYRNAIEQYDSYMKNEFILSQPSTKFGKWGTNLARCGTEVALRLIKRDGMCGIVSPASLLNDQVSNKLRSWIFENYRVLNVSYYPAELKLYGNADISSITIVVQGGETDQSLDVRIYSDLDNYKYKKIEKAVFEYIKRNKYNLPLKTGIEAILIMMHLEVMPTTLDYCNSVGLSFTREMDETRFKEKISRDGRIRFAKGYMVDRYTFKGDSFYLNDDKVIAPPSSYTNKIVWRDVSRDSQVRRI
ncbi:MAG: hypothetical protein VB058_01320, partial [Oscillospiraceae bacterium]|nr:hypothetical protein [Oscillospiraceae bacterium]